MEEEILSPETFAGIEPCYEFDSLTRVSEVKIVYRPIIQPEERPTATSQEEATKLMRPFFEPFIYHHEEAWVMLLNNAARVLGVSRICSGGLNSTMVDIKVLFQHVIKSNATAIILFHNHPSGNPRPSAIDKQLTTRVNEACKLLEVQFLDHVIIFGEGTFSFHEEGLL